MEDTYEVWAAGVNSPFDWETRPNQLNRRLSTDSRLYCDGPEPGANADAPGCFIWKKL